ncbi:MAG: PAS domain S-box protein [Candidatus Anammoxibacter sp.]
MPIKLNNIFAKTILPIIGVFAVGIFMLIFFISQINKQSTIEIATINAKSTIRQYMTLRSYYTKNVVKKVLSKSNLRVTFDHRIRENAIPLPATLIQDLSSLLVDSEGIRLMLYSAFPFPNRGDRVLDDFAKEAIAYFKTNPDETFVKTDLTKGNETVRVAIADKMVDESCVTCHNTHPLTPKKGWKLGDVRGVLEVIVPINYQINANRDVSFVMSYIVGLMFVIIVVCILFLFRRSITNPIKKLSNMSLQVADGKLDTKIDIKSRDEIGLLAGSFNRMTQNLQKTTVSKDYVDNIFKSMLDTLIVLDIDLTIKSVNQAALKLLGYKEDELIGKSVTKIFTEESFTISGIDSLINKNIMGIEKTYQAKDGHKILVLFSSSVMCNNGNVQGIVCVAHDITKRKQMEKSLDERTFLVLLNADIGIALTRNDTLDEILSNCAETLVKHLGVAFTRIWTFNNDKNILELRVSAGMYTYIDEYHKCIPMGKFEIGLIAQERKPHLTNTVIGDPRIHDQEWAKREGMVAFAGYPLIVEDRLVGVMAMFARRTLPENVLYAMESIANRIALTIERKQVVERIIKLTAAVEQSPGIVVITDVNGNIDYVNPKFIKLTGYSLEEVIGKNPRILKSGKQSHEVFKRLWSTITNGNEWKGELHNRKKNGELYWESVSISPIKNSKDVITNYIKSSEDITSRKIAEEQLLKHKEILEFQVKKRTDELKTTYERLVHAEKLSTAGTLSASFAHEFNNPLFGIRNVFETIKERAGLDDENMKFVRMAIRECDRMADLIAKLRDFHRPSSGKKVLMNINKTIDECLLLIKKELKTRGIKLEINYDTDMPEIVAVSDQIKQVILNLLKNAEQAIATDGGKIIVITESFEKEIKIHIKDSGCGINDKELDTIFEPFFTTKAVKGTGLGLFVSYGIIKQHGGDIEVKSQPEVETTFTVTLPVTKHY